MAGGHSPVASSPQEVQGKCKESEGHAENGVSPTGPVQLPKPGQLLTKPRSPRSYSTPRASRQEAASQPGPAWNSAQQESASSPRAPPGGWRNLLWSEAGAALARSADSAHTEQE